MIKIESVGYESDDLKNNAQSLAERLHFKLDKNSSSCLYLSQEALFLKTPNFSLLSADFTPSNWSKRRGEGKNQGIIRACKPKEGMKIVDATAGWGRDAAILAAFGAEVSMLERNPIMHALLEDALLRLSSPDRETMRLQVLATDALSYLTSLKEEDYPDVVYIDPMHPERSKSALVKKEMQVLQSMMGPDTDALQLLEVARTRVKQRVVVKWPQKAGSMLNPDISLKGKTVRFDVYLPSK